VIDVAQGLINERGHVRVEEAVDDGAPAAITDDESEVPQDAELVGDAGCSISNSALSSPTAQGLTRRRARIRTREAVDNAPIRRAMSWAVSRVSGLLTVEWTGSSMHACSHAHTYM